MSFCPSRLLLSGLRARSSSRFAAQKLRAELYYPRRFAGARYLSQDVSQSNTAVLQGVHEELGQDELFNDLDLADADAARLLTPNPDVDGQTALGKPYIRHEDAENAPPHDRKAQVGKVHYYQHTRGGITHVTPRSVNRDILETEMDVRSKALYRKEHINQWRLVCASIYDRKAQGVGLPTDANLLKLDQEGSQLLELLQRGNRKGFQERWQSLNRFAKADQWPRLALQLLEHSRRSVPVFLRITCQDEDKPVFLMVSDCINHVLKFCPDLMDKSLVTECLHPDTWPILLLPQRPVRLFVHLAGRDDVHYAWRRVCEKKTHMSVPTVLCFMKRFTEFGDIESALEAFKVIQDMAHPAFPLDSEAVMRHCCKLLTRDHVVGKGSERNFRILPKLLELGVQPTRDLMNVVLSNAFKSGDSQVAQSILDYMREQGLEPDAYTYLALLTDAVRNGDGERLDSLLQEVEIKEDIRRNPWILSKILHSHFTSIARGTGFEDNPDEVFYSMLGLYTRLHDTTPLVDLGILPSHYGLSEGGDSPPSVVALYLMIATYLRCPKSMANVEYLYSRFRNLVLQNRRWISRLAETDHTYNEFLVAFRANAQGLRPAIRLVEDMLLASSNKDVSRKLDNAGIKHTAPTELTWNILMSCFVFNKQPRAADKVRAMMAKHGIQCDLGTWNMIINNYANSQNVRALAQAIKQMEREGIAADHYTLNPLRYLRTPERLWAALDELDKDADKHHEVDAAQKVPNVEQYEDDDDELLTQALRQIKRQ